MSARHRQAEKRRREQKQLIDAVLRDGVSVGAAVLEAKDIDELIARSSLGTPGAVALRSTAPPEAVEKVLERLDELTGNRSLRTKGAR